MSHLLNDVPVVRSGREETYAVGKDTGRYWDAGATNVHWLIATEDQVESGIKQTLKRVRSDGVFIEENSFSEFIEVDALIMALRESDTKIKSSARRALSKTSAFYIWRDSNRSSEPYELLRGWHRSADLESHLASLPIYTPESFPDLIENLCRINSSVVS